MTALGRHRHAHLERDRAGLQVCPHGKQLPVIRAMGMSWALSRRRVAVLEMTCMRYHTVSQCMSCMRYDTLSHAAMGSAVGIDFPARVSSSEGARSSYTARVPHATSVLL
eukprot:Polyplicarium_translucidae@DN3385_c1_g2_i1.p1